ncbi:MAG TPA: ATP synthase F0 subunit C [Chloroflexota bacterium]|jgi:F-type H+-transporting ATPase subunit c|nr:ATP synthase F0 subunit C [Chloroflexota bacterium]HEX2516415.1 ATP synthase F0 subunit C [Chloroflexota bacterium]
MDADVARQFASGLTIALGGLGPAIAIGLGVRSALEAIGRNPEAENAVRTTMIIGLGLAEAVAIYCLVVALIIAFV